jgi:2,5-furandicarboxylate decarboxylase 1
MPQQSLSEFVNDMERAGMLVRIKEEKRVDELPGIMEANPLKNGTLKIRSRSIS